ELALWGSNLTKALTDLTEKLTSPAFAELDPARVSAYAVGGYGRRELVPFSDVDILFVVKKDKEVDLSKSISFLWSLGLKPSVLIRNLDNLKAAVADDLLFATTLIDARHLFGFEAELLSGPKTWIRSIRPKFAEEHEKERMIRHLKYLGAGHQEPNVRDGRGGLRDLQDRRWIGAMDNWEKRDEALSPGQWEDYRRLLAARAIIHCALEKREDRLLLEEQQTINDWLGWPIGKNFAKETLSTMKRVVRSFDPAPPDPESRVTITEFLNRIGAADEKPPATYLRRCDETGDLGRLIPEWTRIECLTRNDPIHLFTPEEHTLRAVEHLDAMLAEGRFPIDIAALKRRDLLTLALLFHDIGKGSGRDHEVRGREIAEETMERWGYPPGDIALVAFLVNEHLLLSSNAFMRDVHDPSLIHDVAKRIGDIEKLTMLYLLTVADIRAVNVESFSEWKANLLNTLTRRLYRQCQAYLPTAKLAADILRRRHEAVLRLPGMGGVSRESTEGRSDPLMASDALDMDIERHFANIDARYALAHSPEQIASHIKLIPRLTAEKTVIEHHSHPEMGYTEVLVITQTHHGLFAEIAGTLSAKGFNILEADISTRTDGIAIDSFKVSDTFDPDRWKSFDRDLMRLLSKEISAAALIAERMPYARRNDRKGSAAGRKKTAILIDNQSSKTNTVVEVMAPDEMGILYRIAKTFRDCEIGINSAIVSTTSDQVVDVFYVTTRSGEKITDKTGMERMEYLLRQIISTENSGAAIA
ncbi:MAG: HD domain-containing protein, partial [Candidatus Hydrogenedentota bacterium]